ncbi:hypothetical protein Acr_11g0017290 [Actinidia rufa]|uniref:Uncharacterized protein n=1 Tax=Actinidia rufa TaxID=165716 RepID=A0A7J0FFN1_9ERIC|nr:hypothetical protein Acr_11g0017290 [Actinidia rufa]
MPIHSTWRNFIDQINIALISMSYHHDSEAQRTSASCQAVVAFIIPPLVQLKYRGGVGWGVYASSFETHPKSMGACVVSLILYCLSYYAKQRISFGPNLCVDSFLWDGAIGFVYGGVSGDNPSPTLGEVSAIFKTTGSYQLFHAFHLFSGLDFYGYGLHALARWNLGDCIRIRAVGSQSSNQKQPQQPTRINRTAATREQARETKTSTPANYHRDSNERRRMNIYKRINLNNNQTPVATRSPAAEPKQQQRSKPKPIARNQQQEKQQQPNSISRHHPFELPQRGAKAEIQAEPSADTASQLLQEQPSES